MHSNKIRLILAVIAVMVISAGCSITTSSSSGDGQKDASVFLSTDSGDSWRPMVSLPSTDGKTRNIADLNVNLLAMDPSDSLAIYLGSYDNGLYYTYNINNGWNYVNGLPKATISDIKVDPKNKCILYAAVANRLYRSKDCARTWVETYKEDDVNVLVTSVVVDHYNSRNIYIGNSKGDINKSINSGDNWRTIERVEEGIKRLISSPLDSRRFFVATTKNRIFSFTSNTDTDPGSSADIEKNFQISNWTDLNDVLADYNLGNTFRDIIMSTDGVIYLATEKLLLRSPDNGITWENIKLIQPENRAEITAVAVNPKDPKDIYYVTNTTFFRSTDGGATWKTKSLPTKRAGRSLLVDFQNPNNIYLGTIKLK